MSNVAPEADQIRLSLPARHEYARIARIAVAALALRLGFSYREVEDLRLAIDEALIFLLGSDRPGERVTIRFGAEHGHVDLVATAEFDVEPAPEARERFETLVDELVDEWTVTDDAATVMLSKRHVSS
jgi:hypothetical protein